MWKVLFWFLFSVAALVKSDCPNCTAKLAIYEDLRCTPIFEKPSDCCPIKYDCSNIEKRPSGKCTYRGKSYAIHEKISESETYGNCKIGCFCAKEEHIECAILDCPEWLGVRPKPGYHYTYEHDKCCATGQKTAPYVTCKVGDVEYKEGDRFDDPNRPCVECICQPGFKGEFVEPFCKKGTCVEEMDEMKNIKNNCAPSYFPKSCCPFSWICPSEAYPDSIIASKKTANPEMQCKYGSKILNIGDKFERDEIISSNDKFEIRCECRVPPFVTCIQKQIIDFNKPPEH